MKVDFFFRMCKSQTFNQTSRKKRKIKVNKNGDDKGEIPNQWHRNITDHKYYEPYANTQKKKLKEMDKFPDTYNLPRLNQEHILNLNRLIISNEIEIIIKIFQELMALPLNYIEHLKRQ